MAYVPWIVTGARQTDRLESNLGQFDDAKPGNFVVVDLESTSNGSEPVTPDNASLALLDGEGRESQANPGMFDYIPRDRNIFLEQVDLGFTRQGRATFTVATNAGEFALRLGVSEPFSDENGFVDLGF